MTKTTRNGISRRTLVGAAAATGAAAGLGLPFVRSASAQAYPSRPVTVTVPWGAGGGTDATACTGARL